MLEKRIAQLEAEQADPGIETSNNGVGELVEANS
jgi:hypothetical protein